MSLRNLNVLIVSPGFPRWEGDFTHPMVYNLARLLSGLESKISVVTIHYPKTPTRERIPVAEIHRVRYAFPEGLEQIGSVGGIIDDLRSSWLCRLLLAPMLFALAFKTLRLGRKSDVILAQWIPTVLVCLPLKWLFGKTLVVNSRTYPDSAFWKSAYKFLLRFVDGVIYNSADNQTYTQELFAHPYSTVIGSGIRVSQYKNLSPRNNQIHEHGRLSVIIVARLVEFKGVEFALRALKILQDKGLNIEFDIVGDGPLYDSLVALAKNIGVSSRVNFLGARPHSEIPKLLWKSDIFLIPSIVDAKGRTEGFGAVVLEAMSAGVPVVGSRVGGIVDMIKDGQNGLLVNEKDASSIAMALERLYLDPVLRNSLSSRALSFVEDNYSDEVMQTKYSKFLSQLLKTSPEKAYG